MTKQAKRGLAHHAQARHGVAKPRVAKRAKPGRAHQGPGDAKRSRLSKRRSTVREELLALQRRDGVLFPARAVEWARLNPRSALHRSLEWDDDEAAEQYRIWQVRHLIAVHIVNKKGQRLMVSLTIDRVASGGYRDIGAVLHDQTLRDVLLTDAIADLERAQSKYNSLMELAGVWKEVKKARSKYGAKQPRQPTAKSGLTKQSVAG